LAQRRMFSLKIIDTDMFLDMSPTARLLYYDLCMRADDDGFVSSPKKIMKIVGAGDDDLKILIAKKFVIPFESGICVIKHWRIHNYIQKDRYSKTIYEEEANMLKVDNNSVYVLDTKCIQNVYEMDTQVRLGKDRLELGKDNNIVPPKVGTDEQSPSLRINYKKIIELFNSTCNTLSKIKSIEGNRQKTLQVWIKTMGDNYLDELLSIFKAVHSSDFLSGRDGKWQNCSFDWIIKPANRQKILEGNYTNKKSKGINNPYKLE